MLESGPQVPQMLHTRIRRRMARQVAFLGGLRMTGQQCAQGVGESRVGGATATADCIKGLRVSNGFSALR